MIDEPTLITDQSLYQSTMARFDRAQLLDIDRGLQNHSISNARGNSLPSDSNG
jgi:hypothetical protein